MGPGIARTILLVDDAAAATALSERIAGFGYRVIVANSGEEALAAATGDAAVDLVLLDADPGGGIDGIEAARRILEGGNLPVVFITSFPEAEIPGRLRVVRHYGYIARDSGDRILQAAIETALDLFDEQERLRGSMTRLRTLLQTIPDLLWLKDTEGIYLACNTRFEQFFGAEEDVIVGKTDYDFMAREQADSFRENDRQAIETGGPTMNEEWLTSAGDGHRVLVETARTPVFGTDGRCTGILGIARDIGARKQTEQGLRGSEERFRTIFETASDSIKIHDIDTGAIVAANRASPGFYGFETMEEFLQGSIFGDPPYSHADGLRKIQEAAVRGPLSFDWINRKKDGSPLWEETILNAINIGGRDYVLAITRDITSRKRIENELRESLVEKEILIKELHHRVKNNLQVVASLISLQAVKVDDEKYRSYFEESRNRIKAMTLVHEMLYKSENLSRIDFARYIAELAPGLFSSFNAGEKVRLLMDVEKVELGIDLAIPCALITNELVSNSLKHAFPDGRRGEISIRFTVTDGGTNELVVMDNGIGNRAGHDLNTLQTLGLEIVRSLVRQISGSMEIDTSSGFMTRVRF
ncbi:MAG: PAS domain S-box protein [Spirochaetes bacterium]|nr:PAS domain S-box protein [Spirochaetota bacterium]